jgi:hypothetical protein
LEKGSFSWPEAALDQTSVRLSGEELALLLGGIELERTRAKNWWRKERKVA